MSSSVSAEAEAANEEVADHPQALSALALDRINDILDFEIDHILYDKATRLDHFDSLSVSI